MARTEGRDGALRPLLVLTALPAEARGLARRLSLRRVAGTPWPHYRGDRLELAAIGLGATQLIDRASFWLPSSLVISAGLCGGLAPHLSTGDLVVPEAVLGAGEPFPTADVAPLARAGVLVTTTAVVASPGDKARLRHATGAVAVDLESAAILAWAHRHGTAAAVVRGVSDAAGDEVPADLLRLLAPDGTLPLAATVDLLVRRPAIVPRALALGRGTAAALDAVARALRAVADGRR